MGGQAGAYGQQGGNSKHYQKVHGRKPVPQSCGYGFLAGSTVLINISHGRDMKNHYRMNTDGTGQINGIRKDIHRLTASAEHQQLRTDYCCKAKKYKDGNISKALITIGKANGIEDCGQNSQHSKEHKPG